MKVQALILVLLVPWFARGEQQYYGTSVASLRLSGTDSQNDLQTIPLHPGDILGLDNVRAAIQALYDTGRYSSVEVEATPSEGGGTNITFSVRPHFFFSTFRLEPADLLERPLSGYFRLPLGERFTQSAIDRLVEDTKELLRAQGYFEAGIIPEANFDEDTRLVSVVLRAIPGSRAKIGSIRLQGGEQTFPNKDLLEALNLKAGENFSAAKLDDGVLKVRSQFTNLGFLNTRVNVDRAYDSSTKSVDLNVTVQPGQFTLVETRGYDIPKKRLRELVPIFEEGVVDQDLIEEGRVNIERYMQQEGYFEATTNSEFIEAPLDNAIQINYTVVPGASHHIQTVTIQGNLHFTTEEIRARIKVRRSQLFARGVFSADILAEDVRTIQTMYRNAGFQETDVRGTSEEIDHSVDIVIQIQEGKQLPVEIMTFSGNSAISEQDLRREARLNEGDIYTPIAIDQARAALTGIYYARGFADVRVEPIVERIPENSGMKVTFQITEGESYQIGNILVSGNTLTKEKIVHRYSRLYPDTPYNPEAILEGQQRLYATGLFNRVEIVPLGQIQRGIRNLLIQVEDAKPIQITYGIGYQEFERARGTFDISHNNLFGLNRSISARVRGSRRERLFQSTFREPRLFNHDLDGFASTFVEHTERPFFSANRVDFSLQVLKRFSPQENLLLTSTYQTVNLGDIRVNPRASRLPPEQGVCQVCQIARIGASFIQDGRNDALNPSTGTFSTTTFQVASRALGSELNFTSFFNQWSLYSPAPLGVLATSFRMGWNYPFGGTHLLPPTERYFAGGSTTLRGFALDEARPQGGNIMTLGNFEYRVPLRMFPLTGLGGALFYDTGNVFAKIADIHPGSFTHTAGFGLRYQTPVGPVRIDVGVNLKPTVQIVQPDGTKDFYRVPRVKVFFTLGNPF